MIKQKCQTSSLPLKKSKRGDAQHNKRVGYNKKERHFQQKGGRLEKTTGRRTTWVKKQRAAQTNITTPIERPQKEDTSAARKNKMTEHTRTRKPNTCV